LEEENAATESKLEFITANLNKDTKVLLSVSQTVWYPH
jgi:hypothetical protein